MGRSANFVEREEIEARLAELSDRLRRVEVEQGERITRIEPLVDEVVEVVRLLRMADDAARSDLHEQARALQGLTDRLQALPYVSGDVFTSFSSAVGEVTGYRSPPAAADPEGPYARFEDIFRGPTERVVETQRPYLPLVGDHAPVLDLGCGRGEFLMLLAEAGIPATGVDSDPGMVARCRQAGLDVTLAEGSEYLQALEDGSLGTIFCAQVIEHIPVEGLHRLLAVARTKLRGDGLFIAETVNPHSLPALKTFWVDLTHQHPIFPEVALALCGLAGFGSAYVFAPGFDAFEAARFVANSYAVVASPGTPVGR